jgi:hypothetical protein
MEFIAITKDRPNLTPERGRELLRIFSQWQPPEGLNLKSLYFEAGGSRSFALVETDRAALMMEVAATFADYLEFEFVPVIPAGEGASIIGQAQAWVDRMKRG